MVKHIVLYTFKEGVDKQKAVIVLWDKWERAKAVVAFFLIERKIFLSKVIQ